VEAGIDLEAVMELATAPPSRAAALRAAPAAIAATGDAAGTRAARDATRTTPPAGRIAIARDAAFAFAYPHLMSEWRAAGAEIVFFSPLADEPVPAAELIVLPGGYPELHAGRISAAQRFLQSLRNAAQTTDIYGECGGYMVLGETLVDAGGEGHHMAGLLPLGTSFATRRLHLGYRQVSADAGPFRGRWMAHEFHYATTTHARGEPLFAARDAEGTPLPAMGLRAGRVSGSFAHLIDRAPEAEGDTPEAAEIAMPGAQEA